MIQNNKKKCKYTLYTLSDSTGIRYVGITKQSLNARLHGHISSCKQAFKNNKNLHHRHCWIKSLLDKNEIPIINKISEYNTEKEVIKAEIKTITKYKKIYNLVNGTDGGEGVKGHKWTDVQKEKFSSKVDQYDKFGNFIKTFNSYSDAAFYISGNRSNNGKVSQCIKGKYGRRTFYGYVLRKHGEPFDKYPINHTKIMTNEKKKNYRNSKLGNKNPMSRPIIIVNSENVIINIAESVTESAKLTNLHICTVTKILRHNLKNKNFKLFYASEDIVQSLQKCKSSTLKAFVGQKLLAQGEEQ